MKLFVGLALKLMGFYINLITRANILFFQIKIKQFMVNLSLTELVFLSKKQ